VKNCNEIIDKYLKVKIELVLFFVVKATRNKIAEMFDFQRFINKSLRVFTTSI